jgi:hypothetical protein
MSEEKLEVKVGDILAVPYHSWVRTYYTRLKVTKITPTGIIKTEQGISLNPDLTLRGPGNAFKKATFWTKELETQERKEIEEIWVRNALDDYRWRTLDGQIAIEILALLNKRLEEKKAVSDAKESE